MEHRVKPVLHYLFSNFKVSVTQFKASFINASVAPNSGKNYPSSSLYHIGFKFIVLIMPFQLLPAGLAKVQVNGFDVEYELAVKGKHTILLFVLYTICLRLCN